MYIGFRYRRFSFIVDILHSDIALGGWTHTTKKDFSVIFAFVFFWLTFTYKKNNL